MTAFAKGLTGSDLGVVQELSFAGIWLQVVRCPPEGNVIQTYRDPG